MPASTMSKAVGSWIDKNDGVHYVLRLNVPAKFIIRDNQVFVELEKEDD